MALLKRKRFTLNGLNLTAFNTVLVILAVSGSVLILRALIDKPDAAESVRQVRVLSPRAVFIETQRVGTWATGSVYQGQAIAFKWNAGYAQADLQGSRSSSNGSLFFILNSDLRLDDARVERLAQRAEWNLRLVDREVVGIFSDDQELLPYSEFVGAKAQQRWRWKIYGVGLISASIAGLVALFLLNRLNHKGVKS